MKFFARWLVLGVSLVLGQNLLALAPKPEILNERGFSSWLGPQSWMPSEEVKAWRMERLLYELRQKDDGLRNQALESLGFRPQRVGDNSEPETEDASDTSNVKGFYAKYPNHWNGALFMPKPEEPIKVDYVNLSFNYRRMAVLSFPCDGRAKWEVVIFVQKMPSLKNKDGVPEEDSAEEYWQPWQLFEFDTDPVPGIQIQYPDILNDRVLEMAVRHQIKDDHYGNRDAISIFKFDERGDAARFQLVWQETDQYFRSGKFQGDPIWMSQKLHFGNQRIQREILVKKYHYTKEGEENRYQETKPYKVVRSQERFSWNPILPSFYDAETELEKLRDSKSELIRLEAARRLGLILETSHPILLKAALHDKSAYVRAQAALALGDIPGNIGNAKLLAALKNAEKNTEEDSPVLEALDITIKKLEAGKGEKNAALAKNKKSKKKYAAKTKLAKAPAGKQGSDMGPGANPIPTVGPKINDARK